ncbi:hypothetical protein [Photobacterium damselae]|uniref:hypothetical protein n=1 Tax=Photobacterium damselae TaxID=38293 RepID=UPI0013A5B392|nr:hypothetical protein [Photobacterium damselae]
MDNVIQLLNSQYDITQTKDHGKEITLNYQYLIDTFGNTSTTVFKLHEVLITLVYIREFVDGVSFSPVNTVEKRIHLTNIVQYLDT